MKETHLLLQFLCQKLLHPYETDHKLWEKLSPTLWNFPFRWCVSGTSWFDWHLLLCWRSVAGCCNSKNWEQVWKNCHSEVTAKQLHSVQQRMKMWDISRDPTNITWDRNMRWKVPRREFTAWPPMHGGYRCWTILESCKIYGFVSGVPFLNLFGNNCDTNSKNTFILWVCFLTKKALYLKISFQLNK